MLFFGLKKKEKENLRGARDKLGRIRSTHRRRANEVHYARDAY